MRKLTTILMMCLSTMMVVAQVKKPLPPIHVEGRWLVDNKGNRVVLHGVMDTPNAWFNGGRWGWNYDDEGRIRCLDYFEKMLTALEIANCDIFRLHLEVGRVLQGAARPLRQHLNDLDASARLPRPRQDAARPEASRPSLRRQPRSLLRSLLGVVQGV